MLSKEQEKRTAILTTSQRIFEDLLKAQEFEDGQIHRGVKSKTSLVWTQSRVELHTVSSVHLHLSLVILPDHSELDHSFGNGSNLEGGLVFGILLEEGGILEGGDELCCCETWSAGRLGGESSV